jgi:hypothetical protein
MHRAMTSTHVKQYTDFLERREMRFQMVEWEGAHLLGMRKRGHGGQKISDGHLTGFVVFGMPDPRTEVAA